MKQETMIEGIGDEVITFVVTTLSVVIVCYTLISYRVRQQGIHPDSLESVQSAREHLQTEVPQSSSERRQSDTTCPICLGEVYYAIETNCGHIFCGRCIITYWEHGNWLGSVRCPVCRQQVILLLSCFTDEEIQSQSEEKIRLLQLIKDYNRRFSGEPRPVMDYLWDIPTLLRHSLHELFSFHGLMFMFRVRIIVCAIIAFSYLISPLDIVPEAVFGIFGLFDDLFVLLLVLIYITIAYREFVAQRE